MAFDYSKLVGRIIEKFGTRKAFAATIGMSESAVSARLNNITPWKPEEIKVVCAPDILDIPDEAISEYFFTLKVE